jgi:hypothetical protein
LIVADGFACRSQIRQFCESRQPMHLAQLLNLEPNRLEALKDRNTPVSN